MKAVEKRTGLKIACLEEIAFRMGYVNEEDVRVLIKNLKGEYFEYLKAIIQN